MSDSEKSSSSSSTSSSDDGIFTEHVDLQKKTLHHKTSSHIAATAHSPTTHDEPSAKPGPGESRLASFAAPSEAAGDATPSLEAQVNTNSDDVNTVTAAELSVAALQAMSDSTVPLTQRSASTNTEASSTQNEPTNEDRRKARRRRRLVGGTRPPLHKRALTATTPDSSDFPALSPPYPPPSLTSELGSCEAPVLARRRSTGHSASTGDLAAASLNFASNELPAASTVPTAANLRAYKQRPIHAVSSTSAMCSSPQSSGPAMPVAAHLLSDEAYLDTYRIPALIAQLSLSLMAAKPVDLRAFARDWLADRLVSEEDEEDDTAGHGSGSADADVNAASSAAATRTTPSHEQNSNHSYGMGASCSISDAVSNHSSARNTDIAASSHRGRSNATSLQASTRGNSNVRGDAEGKADGDGEEEEQARSYDSIADVKESPLELFATTSERPVLMGAMARAQRGTERKNLVRRKPATSEDRVKERRRKRNEPSGAMLARGSARHKPVRHGTRTMKDPESNSCSEATLSAATPSKAAQNASPLHASHDGSSPNASIMRTMAPQETSAMTEEEKKGRAKMLEDMAEAAFLHEASEAEAKAKAEKAAEEHAGEPMSPKLRKSRGRSSSGHATPPSPAGTAAAARASPSSLKSSKSSSSSSSSSSDSFFDSPKSEGVGWTHIEVPSPSTVNTPSFAALKIKNGGGDSHAANMHKGERQHRSLSLSQQRQGEQDPTLSSLPLPIPLHDIEGPAKSTTMSTYVDVSSMTEANGSTFPIDRQFMSSPSASTTTAASSCVVATALGTNKRANMTSAQSIPSTPSPEPSPTTMATPAQDESVEERTPPSSKLHTPPSTTAELSVNASALGSNTTGCFGADTKVGEEETIKKSSTSSSSSSSSNEGNGNTSFAMFAPLIAVDSHTHEVIDYRNAGPPPYPGAPPLSIPASGASRMSTPPIQGAPPGYLLSSLSLGTNNNNMSGGSAASASAVAGASHSHQLSQTHASTMSNPPAQFPPYALRVNSGAFNILPTPMLADMVGGSGLTNSSFGRRGVQNNSFGRRSGAAGVAAATLARQGEHAMTPSTASLAAPPFLTPHELGNVGMTNNWKSVPNTPLAGFSRLSSNGATGLAGHASTVNNANLHNAGADVGKYTNNGGSGGGGGCVNESSPRIATGNLAASLGATSKAMDTCLEGRPYELPTSYCQSSHLLGKVDEVNEKDHKNSNGDHSDAEMGGGVSKQDISTSSVGAGLGSSVPATLKVDAARRLGKLIDQLPISKYPAAIVFLEGLMSSTANSDGVDASGSDMMSTTTTVGAASARSGGRFTVTDSAATEPGNVSTGLASKSVSPVVNADGASHPWSIPSQRESSPLGGMPTHGISSFVDILSSNPALGSGAGGSDSLSTVESLDATRKSAAAIAKTIGSASVEAIVRDALSQSVLRTLPQTHSGTEILSGVVRATSNTTSSHAATPTAVSPNAGAAPPSNEHMPVRAVNLSSVRLDTKGELGDLQLFANITSAATTDAAATPAVGLASTISNNGSAESPTNQQNSADPVSVAGGGGGGDGRLSSLPPAQGQADVIPSFYKRPSGNDLSSLCRNSSVEELASGSPVGPEAPHTRRFTLTDSRLSGMNHNEAGRGTEEEDSARRHADLQAVSASFASALAPAHPHESSTTQKGGAMPSSPLAVRERGAAMAEEKEKEKDKEGEEGHEQRRERRWSEPIIPTVSASTTTTATATPAESHVKPLAEHVTLTLAPGSAASPAIAVGVAPLAMLDQEAHPAEESEKTKPDEGAADASKEEEGKEPSKTSSRSSSKSRRVYDSPPAPPAADAAETSFGAPQPCTMQKLSSCDEAQAASAHPSPVIQESLSALEQTPEDPIRSLPSFLLHKNKESEKEADASTRQDDHRVNEEESSHSVEDSEKNSHASSNRQGAAEGSITLPAGSELPHSKPDDHKGDDDDDDDDDDESREPPMRRSHKFITAVAQTLSNSSQATLEKTAGEMPVSVTSTEVPIPSDSSQPLPVATTTANANASSPRSEVGSDSISSSVGAPFTRTGPKPRRRRSKVEFLRRGDSSRSWHEVLPLSSPGEMRSPTSGHAGPRHSSPLFLQVGRTFSSTRRTCSGPTFITSPPLPLLTGSILSGSKDETGESDTSGENLKHFDDDIDLGATLRTAVVMAAAAGSHVPHRCSSSAAGAPFGIHTTQSSSHLQESLASTPFSPRGALDNYRFDLAMSSPSCGPVSPQSPGCVSCPAAAAAAASTKRPSPQQLENSSAVPSRTISPHGTQSNPIAADSKQNDGSNNNNDQNSGGHGQSLSVVATQGAGSTTPDPALASPSTQLSLSLLHTPPHEPLVTSSVAAAMNSFLWREDRVAPEEVEIVREAVAHFDAFAALDETQLETLVRTMARVELAQGQTLMQEGGPTLEKLLLVVAGKLSISRKGLVTRSFTRGQFYGEMEMSYHIERSRVTLTAVVPTIVYALTKVDYQKLVIHEKEARRYMFLQYVNQCNLFKGLSPPMKMRLADSFRVCRLRKGAKLTEQGASVQWMYLLMSGTVRMTCKPLPAGTNSAFGGASGHGGGGEPSMSAMRRAVTTDGDTAGAAAASHSIVEMFSSVTNFNDPQMMSVSSTMQGPNFSRLVGNSSSPILTSFHRPSALLQMPEGKPGTGVQELLQLAESKMHSAELRKSSCSINATPLHTSGLLMQPAACGNCSTVASMPSRLNSGIHEEISSGGSAVRNARFLSSGDGFEDALAKTTSSSRSENRSVVTKGNGMPQQRQRRRRRRRQQKSQQEHRHTDPNVLTMLSSHHVVTPRLSMSQPALASLDSTAASLDPSAVQRSAPSSPSTASVNAKRSISSINASSPRPEKPEDTLVVVDRAHGQLVGETEFVFKCKGLFTAVATAPVQAARISRLHFEAIMNRSVVEELKRSMLLNPDYYYFESTVPEELKQEMRWMLFRLNVGSSAKRRSQFALPSALHHGSYRGGSGEKFVSRSGAVVGGSNADAGNTQSNHHHHHHPSNSNLNLSSMKKRTDSRQPSASASSMRAAAAAKLASLKESLATPSSPTAKSTSKRCNFRTVKVRCNSAGSNAEEVSSVHSGNNNSKGAKGSTLTLKRARRHRTAPLERSPAPDSEGRGGSVAAEIVATGSPADNADAAALMDQPASSNTTGSSGQYLAAPSVSNHAVYGSSSSAADVSPTTATVDEASTHTGRGDSANAASGHVGGSGGGGGGSGTGKEVSLSVIAGRSRTGPRRDTTDNQALSAKHSSTAGSRSRRISARGEIIFSGSRNLYRFTADAMSLNQSIVIAVVVDGTIIRWNSVAQSVTGYAPFETIGKSIYDFIASEEGRQQMRDVLSIGAHYAGKWEQYMEQHLQENRVFPFRQNTGLYQVGLALSVVPSNYAKTAEVLLLVGREGKYRAANTYASDVARWLEGSLKPQLRQFQRRMVQIESHGWRVTSEDALQVKGNLDACISMVEQFTKFSLLNMEAVNESWRPVRLPALLGRFAVEASAFARQRGHEYYCNIEQVEPKTDIFFDAPQTLAILRLLLADAFMSSNRDDEGNPIVVHAELRVTVVEPQDTHAAPGGSTGSLTRLPNSGLGAASPISVAAPGPLNAAAGTKISPAPLFGATSSGLQSYPSNAALAMTADQHSFHPRGGANADPLLHVAPLHPTQGQLQSHEVEEASRIPTAAAAVGGGSHSRLAHASSTGNLRQDDAGGSGDPPNAFAANTNANASAALDTPPSVNVAATTRGAMSATSPNALTGRAATASCASVTGATSPNSAVSASLSSSLRRIRFELRDDGPTVPSLRSPEAVAAESVRVVMSPNLSHAPAGASTSQASPSAAPLCVEGFPSVASSVAPDSSRRSSASLAATKPTRGAELQQVEKILSNLGGTIYGFTRPEAACNVVRVELPLLAVPGASEDGRDDENGMTTNGGVSLSSGSRTFTVIVADNNRMHQQQLCQILWARQHAVVPVTSFRDLVRKLEMNTTDILLIDPLQIDITSEDYESLLGDDPFDDIRILSARLALVVITSDFSDWRVQKLLNRHAVVELPKVGSGALVHIAMQEAEQLVAEMRDEEERLDLIRRTFTNCSAERHKIGKRIGKGAFGDVYEVEDTLTGGKMAMKRMRLHDGLLADEVVQEILAMTTLKHENIIQYFYCEKESDTQLRLYMELAPGGTLRDKIREHPGVSLPFEDIVHHLSDICHGLAYVHEQRYVHGDLKTANLLLGTRGRTKIGDFGTAKHLAPHQLLYTMVGTPQYMAPEVLTADVEERLGYDFKADIWSLGCIVLEMATGSPPFAHLDCAQGMGIIKYLTELTDTPDLSPLFSGNPLVYEFVKSCLDIDPQNRPTAQELLHFDILEGAVASQRAERLVKRAEMLYKLNKYAAMRADGSGGGGHGNDSGLLYSEEDSNATEDYDYYDEEDEGDLSEDASSAFDGADNVSTSEEEEEEEGEYADEEYEFSSSGSGSARDTYKHERHVAELNSAIDNSNNMNTNSSSVEISASPGEQNASQTTQSWQSSQEHVGSSVEPTAHERPTQSPPTFLLEDVAATQNLNEQHATVEPQPQPPQEPEKQPQATVPQEAVMSSQTETVSQAAASPQADAAPPAAVQKLVMEEKKEKEEEEEGGEKAQETEHLHEQGSKA
ncbi:protein kinase [Lotmaria passim]